MGVASTNGDFTDGIAEGAPSQLMTGSSPFISPSAEGGIAAGAAVGGGVTGPRHSNPACAAGENITVNATAERRISRNFLEVCAM
jgi:hypothetical protein